MDTFDASKVTPQQGVGGHPPGRFPFTITNTSARENKDKTGAMLVVEMTSDVGRIENRYNIWNASAQAVEIAQKELSALCHAVGIFRVTFPRLPDNSYDMANAARELRGGRGIMEVAPQTDKQGQPNGYMEVKKVFDAAGNEPGKQGSAPQPQAAGWGNNNQPQAQPQPQANPNPQPQGWAPGPNGGPAQQQQQQPPAQQPQGWGQPTNAAPQQPSPSQPGNAQQWQPGGGAPNAAPPWGK